MIKAFASAADGDDDVTVICREIGNVAAHVDDGLTNIAGEDKLQS
jgi:hypothetical protein